MQSFIHSIMHSITEQEKKLIKIRLYIARFPVKDAYFKLS